MWWVGVYKLDTMKQDADAPMKLVNDAIMGALGRDDTWLGVPVGGKRFVYAKDQQKLHLWMRVFEVTNEHDFNTRTDAFIDEILAVLAGLKD